MHKLQALQTSSNTIAREYMYSCMFFKSTIIHKWIEDLYILS